MKFSPILHGQITRRATEPMLLATGGRLAKMPGMIASASALLRRQLDMTLARPLKLYEALATLALLLAIGTVYCQIYCLLALQKMHGDSMPALASLLRVSSDLVPAFAAFELGKRLPSKPKFLSLAALVMLLLAAAALGLAIRSNVHVMSLGISPRRMFVDRLPFMILAGILVLVYRHRVVRASAKRPWGTVSDGPDCLPPPKSIDWVKAAGNYVEIRVGGRTHLMRTTLRQMSAKLPPAEFVQIHRSVIVNRARVATVRSSRVELTDGNSFSVGDAYRGNLSLR